MDQPTQIPNEFKAAPASKQNILVRAFFDGTQWAGKTFSALAFASGLCPEGKVIGVVDTEGEASNDYADHFNYIVMPLNAPYSPDRYRQAIEALMQQYDIGVLIIDSISHEWEGSGGVLEAKHLYEQQYKAQRGKNADSYYTWREYTMVHNRFLEYLIHLPTHLIQTCRTKPHYEVIAGQRQKIGADIKQREGIEFEQNIHLSFDAATHTIATVEKDRYGIFTAGELVKKEHGFKLLENFKGGPVQIQAPVQVPVPEHWVKYLEQFPDCPVKTHPDELKAVSYDWHEHWLKTSEAWSTPPPAKQQEVKPEQTTKEVVPEQKPEPEQRPVEKPMRKLPPQKPATEDLDLLFDAYRAIPAHAECPDVKQPEELNTEPYREWHTHWKSWEKIELKKGAERFRKDPLSPEFDITPDPEPQQLQPGQKSKVRSELEYEFTQVVPESKARKNLIARYYRAKKLSGRTSNLSDQEYKELVKWCRIEFGRELQKQEMAGREEKPESKPAPELQGEPAPKPTGRPSIPDMLKQIVNLCPQRGPLEKMFKDFVSLSVDDEPVTAFSWDKLNEGETISFLDYVETTIAEQPERKRLNAELVDIMNDRVISNEQFVTFWQDFCKEHQSSMIFTGPADERVDLQFLKKFLEYVITEAQFLGGDDSKK